MRAPALPKGEKIGAPPQTARRVRLVKMDAKIVVMQDGRIEQVGTPMELYNQPKNVFVASFIGAPSMNLIQGTVRRGHGLGVEANGYHLPVGAECGVDDGQSVFYGIRPEHLDVDDDGFPARLLAVGGGTKNRVWRQATSDIAGIDQVLCENTVGASYGDAFMAADRMVKTLSLDGADEKAPGKIAF